MRWARSNAPFAIVHRRYPNFCLRVNKLGESWHRFVRHVKGKFLRWIKACRNVVRRMNAGQILSQAERRKLVGARQPLAASTSAGSSFSAMVGHYALSILDGLGTVGEAAFAALAPAPRRDIATRELGRAIQLPVQREPPVAPPVRAPRALVPPAPRLPNAAYVQQRHGALPQAVRDRGRVPFCPCCRGPRVRPNPNNPQYLVCRVCTPRASDAMRPGSCRVFGNHSWICPRCGLGEPGHSGPMGCGGRRR